VPARAVQRVTEPRRGTAVTEPRPAASRRDASRFVRRQFSAQLISYQETPLTLSTAGFGKFRAKLVNNTTLRYVLQYTDLEGGNVLFAHVHIGQRATTGGAMFFLCGGGGKPAYPNGKGRGRPHGSKRDRTRGTGGRGR
jgi:CHRD domain-containing protein